MDSKLKKATIFMAILILLIVAGVVAAVNWPSIRARFGQGEAAETSAQNPDGAAGAPGDGQTVAGDEARRGETRPEGQIGSDLSAFLQDETFFDPEKKPYESIEVRSTKRLSLVMTSVEKDLRIQVVDGSGKPVPGIPFEVTLDNGDSYKDEDMDGVIYIDRLKAGEYEVELNSVKGYVTPEEPAKIVVKQSVEYVAIDDIELLILTENDVDAGKEDITEDEARGDADGSEITDFSTSNENASLGIDVSKWNKEIDWEKVKEDGVEFAIIRCGYRGASTGALIEDPFFRANMDGAKKAGIPVGVYFVSQALNEVEAVEEASMAVRLCRDYRLSYPIFLDSEGAGGKGRADGLGVDERTVTVKAFCETVREEGYRSGVYAARNWLNDRLDMDRLSKEVVWLAEYREVPEYSGYYQMWQYTSNGKIDGISGRVDLNVSYLNPADAEETGSVSDSDMEESDAGADSGTDAGEKDRADW